MEQQVAKIKQNLKEDQNRKKNYADRDKVHREFQVGDKVFLKVKGKKKFNEVGKLQKVGSQIMWTI